MDLQRKTFGMSRATLVAMLLLPLALIVAGSTLGYVEARSYLTWGTSSRERFEVLASGSANIGVSVASRTLALRNCLEAMTSVIARAQPRTIRGAASKTCLAISDGIVAQEPSNSLGWFVGAVAAGELSDVAGMTARLGEAQRTGPTEQWLAQMRVELAEQNYPALSTAVRDGNDRDLTLLVQSQDGVAAIARRFVQQPDFRSRITALVERLPALQQRRFVGYVQQAAEGVGAR